MRLWAMSWKKKFFWDVQQGQPHDNMKDSKGITTMETENKYPWPKINRFITLRIRKSRKGQGFTETVPSIYVLSMINRFSFGHLGTYLLYNAIITQKNEAKTYLVFLLSVRVSSPPSCLFCQQPQRFLRKQILWNFLFVNTFCYKTELKSSFCLFTWHCFKMAPDDVT